MDPIPRIPLDDIRAARARLDGQVRASPVVPVEVEDAPCTVLAKLECLHPIGSFKLRGATNAMMLADPDTLRSGVYTASAGNMAQGVAWAARRLGVPCRVIVPGSAPRAKLDAIERLGATWTARPYAEWWRVLVEHGDPDEPGLFVHPVSDPAVIAGNGTAGLEILEQVSDVDAIVVPYGGGGLSSGIACAVKALKPDVRVYAAEVETAAPFATSLEAGEPVRVEREPSFVDGIGTSSMLEEMWPLASDVLDGSIVVSLDEIADAIRLLATRAHVIAEGAGGASVAAALTGAAGEGTVVAVVSGGNLDAAVLATILGGRTP